MRLYLGKDCRVYRNSSAYDTPNWNVNNVMKDLNINIEDGEAEASSRESSWELMAQGLRKGSLDFESRYDATSTEFMKIFGAMVNRTAIDLAILDQAISVDGAMGLRAVFAVFSAQSNEPLDNGKRMSFSLKPTIFTAPQLEPRWQFATGSTLSDYTFS